MKNKILKISIGDILELNNRVYRIELRDYAKSREKRGKRPQLILLRDKELTELILTKPKNINNARNLKGGIENDI